MTEGVLGVLGRVPALDLTRHRQLAAQASALRFQGRVVQVVGLSIEVEGLRLPLGEICHLYPERATAGASRITAEVVGFREERLILMPFAETHGVRPGTAVFPSGRGFTVPVGPARWVASPSGRRWQPASGRLTAC